MKKRIKTSKTANKKLLEKKLDKAWSEYVRKRDKVCQKCGGNSPISSHHAFGRRHIATRWDVFNGVGLCYPCHIHWSHRDPSGFSVWFEEHIGKDQYLRLAEAHRQVFKPSSEELQGILDNINTLECKNY